MSYDNDVSNKLQEIETSYLDEVLECLKKRDIAIRNFLADVVATLCDVDKNAMLTTGNVVNISQARWLFWYAYRYMTSESYAKIADITASLNGKHFTLQSVASSVSRMAMMIDKEPMWKKRWEILRRIIKSNENTTSEKNIDNTIVIHVPKGIKEFINIEIKEK